MKEKTATKSTATKSRASSQAKARTSKTKTAAAAKQTKPRAKTKRRTSAKPAEPVSNATESEREHIELKAYFIYRDRIAHGVPGDELSDWLAAETEVLAGAEALVPA